MDSVVLVSIPLSFEQFTERWIANSDFLHYAYGDDFFVGPERLWEQQRKTSVPMLECLASLSRINVPWFQKATCADFKNALNTYSTVILIAHWRPSTLALHHIADERLFREKAACTLSEMLANYESPPCLERNKLIDISSIRVSDFSTKEMVACLNEVITGSLKSLKLNLCGEDFYSDGIVEAYRRNSFDNLLSQSVCRGNCFEFWDGYVQPADVASDVDIRKETFLDLAVCTSYFAAFSLKKALGENLRVMASAKPVPLVIRTALIASALKMATRGGCSYEEALKSIIFSILDEE